MISRSWSPKFPLLSPPEAEAGAGAGREVELLEVLAVQLMFLFRDPSGLSDLPDLHYTATASHSHLGRDLFRTK